MAHSCGHDMRATALLSAARLLTSAQDNWSGTLVITFRPAQELGIGARSMVDDGLCKNHAVAMPDLILAGHIMPLRAGRVGTKPGLMANNADTMHVTMHGRGAHFSVPNKAIGPVVVPSNMIVRLQNIVSREEDTHDVNVVTVALL